MRTRAMLACRAKRRKNARKLGLLSGEEQGAGGKRIQGKRLSALTPLTSLTPLTPKYREYSRKKTNGFNFFNSFNSFNSKKLSECET